MKLILDDQLPAALAVYLRGLGHDASLATDHQLGRSDDVTIWDHAERIGAVVVSRDSDFADLANGTAGPGQLVWVRLGNCRNAALVAAFDRDHGDMVRAVESGRRIFELW